jgi:Ras family
MSLYPLMPLYRPSSGPTTCLTTMSLYPLQVSTDDAQAYADENGLVYWETSAKTNANVSELFEDIAKRCASAARALLPPHARPTLLCSRCTCAFL